MKYLMCFILIVAIVVFRFFSVSASEVLDEIEIEDDLADALPEEAEAFMKNNNPSELTFGAVMSEIWGLFKKEVTAPVKLFVSLAGVNILCAAAEALRDSGGMGGKSSVQAFQMAGLLAGAGIMSASIAELVARTSQTLSAVGAFMLTFIPILAGIMAVMGQLASANLFNGAVLAAAQIFSQVMITALMPLSASILGVSIAGAVNPDLKTEKLANFVKTAVIWVLGFSATVFVGLLSIQSLVAGSADSVAMKAVKFTVSGGVPIIGGAVGDALGVVNGSVAVLKSTTGAFGIVAVSVICLPPVISVICFRLALTAAAAVSGLFGAEQLGSLLKSGESVLSIILAMLVCFSLIMLISAALMIRLGSGG